LGATASGSALPRLECLASRNDEIKEEIMSLRVYIALMVMVALATTSANGQSCQQGGSHICGPNCNIYYDIIWDPNFSQTTCGAWQFDQGTQRALSGTYCGGWPAPFGKFNGPSNGWRSISQSTTAQSQGSNFSFRYEYEITDPLNDPLTSLDIWIVQPNGSWFHVDQPPGGSQWCRTRQKILGSHPDWTGQPLQIYIFGYLPNSNSNIIIDNISLNQS
jgi:hypothetical protein